jgi:undecaprenyl diphosphate synthase
LVIAANYGGRWDMTEACKIIAQRVASGELSACKIDETLIDKHLSMADLPEPDLFIRTGGEQRVSNFMLWQLAYTEFYFTPILWPDFDKSSLQDAISNFKSRQRRFGHTGEQIVALSTS